MIIAAKEFEKSVNYNLQITPLATKLLAINIRKRKFIGYFKYNLNF
jgi:hypothetical protein